MDIEQLKQLVSKGESQQLEFKKTTSQLKPVFETLCAFLNGGGGTVLFGVTDNGQILGQQVHDKTRQELARELSKIEPKATPDIHYIYYCLQEHLPEGIANHTNSLFNRYSANEIAGIDFFIADKRK